MKTISKLAIVAVLVAGSMACTERTKTDDTTATETAVSATTETTTTEGAVTATTETSVTTTDATTATDATAPVTPPAQQ